MEKPTTKEAGFLGCYSTLFILGLCIILGRNFLLFVVLIALFIALVQSLCGKAKQ